MSEQKTKKIKEIRTLLILRGAPGSGKTTHAKKLVQEGWKRVNRDDLRTMIDNGVWGKEKEKAIITVEQLIVGYYLVNGCNVVIDDTNISEKTVKLWRTTLDSVVVKELILHPPLNVCLQRNNKRKGTPAYVPEDVVIRFWNQMQGVVDKKGSE